VLSIVTSGAPPLDAGVAPIRLGPHHDVPCRGRRPRRP